MSPTPPTRASPRRVHLGGGETRSRLGLENTPRRRILLWKSLPETTLKSTSNATQNLTRKHPEKHLRKHSFQITSITLLLYYSTTLLLYYSTTLESAPWDGYCCSTSHARPGPIPGPDPAPPRVPPALLPRLHCRGLSGRP